MLNRYYQAINAPNRFVLKTPLVCNHGPTDQHVRLREGRRSWLVCRRRQGTSAVADHDRQAYASSRGAARLTVDQPLDPPAEPDRTRAKLSRSLSSLAGGSRSRRRTCRRSPEGAAWKVAGGGSDRFWISQPGAYDREGYEDLFGRVGGVDAE